jgi:nucleotide-binding universal stress UspA family protein
MKILVPIDGSDLDTMALQEADTQARAADAEIVLVSVANPEQTDERRMLEENLKQRASLLTMPVRYRIEESVDAAQGILQAMEEETPDMVVIASGDTTSPTRIGQASVTRKIQEVAQVPVKMVGLRQQE